MSEYSDAKWHVDKRISVGTLVGLLIQTITFAVLFGVLLQKVETNTAQVLGLQVRESITRARFEELVALQADVRHLLAMVNRIEDKLDREPRSVQ